jgi:DNA modification methylase
MDYKKDLAEKLPQLKNIEGFPIGKDEDILALSQPPHYTVCPNPYIEEFIKEHGKPYDEKTDTYSREPFVGDVSFGRNDPLLNAHFYHTKVPPKAIEISINHYTNQGDIVLDGFGGTGTTGIAASRTNRKAIVSDLSPIASFISANQNIQVAIPKIIDAVKNVSKNVQRTLNELYSLKVDSQPRKINYTIWSDAFECPICKEPYFYFDKFVDFENDTIRDNVKCSNCGGHLEKDNANKVFEEFFDPIIGRLVNRPVQRPALISYIIGTKKSYKKPDSEDFELIHEIENSPLTHWVPSNQIMFKGDEFGDLWRAGYHKGYTNTHHFYSKRNLIALSAINAEIEKLKSDQEIYRVLKFIFTSLYSRSHRMNRYIPEHGRHVGPLSGTLYMSNLQVEINVGNIFEEKSKSILRALAEVKRNNVFISTQSVTSLSNLIPENSIDYIYTDPPFGDNLPYSELNFLMEDWIRIHTNTISEAIINTKQQKGIDEYNSLMLLGFSQYFKILKPNRWITVVFHNSKSKVWSSIQDAITKAGFVISSVSVLDKKKGTTKQLSYSGAVKNDLIISAFKPKTEFIQQFEKSKGVELEHSFIHQFLQNLPLRPVIERTKQMLYSKMVAYYIQRGYEIRYDAKSFYSLLNQNFMQEDGFWFTANQISSYLEYKKKMKLEGMDEVKAGGMYLFVSDEKSAIVWLFNFLSEPKSFSDISVAFNQLANIQGDAMPELRDLLEQNFVAEDGKYRRPKSEPEHNQLTEKRERALMREFESLLIQATTEKKKIKDVRKEALVFGFEVCYKDKRFKDIMTLAQRLDKSILENSGELSDFVEAAQIQLEGIS